jgi:hypothetical protein
MKTNGSSNSKTSGIYYFYLDNLIDSFLKEVGILVSAQHKKIVSIKDFKINGLCRKQNGKTKKILYYTMALAENG